MVQEVEKRRDLFEKRLKALQNPEETLAEGLTEQEKGFRSALRFCLNKINDVLDGRGDKS
jgi:chaperonin cofactor prefoldin